MSKLSAKLKNNQAYLMYWVHSLCPLRRSDGLFG